jgi:type IV pilus assembly protein PilB
LITESEQKSQSTARFGEWLVSQGVITHDQLCQGLNEQAKAGGRLGDSLCKLNILSQEDITRSLSGFLNIDCYSLEDISNIDLDMAREIPENIAKRFNVVALSRDGDEVLLAMSDPLNIIATDTVALKLKCQVKPVLAPPNDITRAIDLIYHGGDLEEKKLRELVDVEISTEEDLIQEDDDVADISKESDAAEAPVIRFVDLLLSQAVKKRASDIHVEPQEKNMSVRMRVDGVLVNMVPPPRKMQAAIIARLKILSDMDIAERRLPQDGRFKIRAPGREIDVRVSSIPAIYGEKIVMRILDKTAVSHDLDVIGLEDDLLVKLKRTLQQPHGIIIVTGPTGSGKSTTLYSALNYLKDPRKNITTVEDPVEYRMEGINQIQIKPEIDLDFAICLRAILRQDPDIILIGEIRDKETMEIAIKASLTGHLVLSTFHTNDAPSAISRLTYMGLEPYLLSSSLNLIIAQRLVRKICDKCKEPIELSEEVIKKLKLTEKDLSSNTFYRGKG